MRLPLPSLASTLLLLAACGDDGSAADTESATGTGTDDGSTGPSNVGSTGVVTTGATTTDAMTTEVDGSSSGDPPSECGDGDVNIGEQCDDGNDDDTDACSNDCVASCGVLWNENMPADFIASSMAIDSAGNVVVLGAQIDATMTMASPASRTYDADGAFVGDVVSGVQWLASEGYAVLDADDNTFAFVNAQETAEAMPSLRLYKFDAAQAELFDVPVPAAVFDSSAGEPGLEVDVSPEGDAVLVAGIEIADGDDDIWVAKYSGVDGSELWATTHSGPLQGGFSTDQGGRVAVADDGTIYVAARIRNTFDQQPVVVLRFAPDGGPAEIEEVVFGDPGANNEQFPVQIATNGTQTAVGVNVFGGGTLDSRAAVGLLEGDAVAWTVLASDDLEKTKKISIGYARPAVAIDGDGNVLVAHSEEIDPDPTDGFIDVEVVVARYDSMGAIQCNHRWAILDSFRRPLSAEVLDDGTMVAFGTGGGGDWIARFRR